jgi:hypothetical protein
VGGRFLPSKKFEVVIENNNINNNVNNNKNNKTNKQLVDKKQQQDHHVYSIENISNQNSYIEDFNEPAQVSKNTSWRTVSIDLVPPKNNKPLQTKKNDDYDDNDDYNNDEDYDEKKLFANVDSDIHDRRKNLNNKNKSANGIDKKEKDKVSLSQTSNFSDVIDDEDEEDKVGALALASQISYLQNDAVSSNATSDSESSAEKKKKRNKRKKIEIKNKNIVTNIVAEKKKIPQKIKENSKKNYQTDYQNNNNDNNNKNSNFMTITSDHSSGNDEENVINM